MKKLLTNGDCVHHSNIKATLPQCPWARCNAATGQRRDSCFNMHGTNWQNNTSSKMTHKQCWYKQVNRNKALILNCPGPSDLNSTHRVLSCSPWNTHIRSVNLIAMATHHFHGSFCSLSAFVSQSIQLNIKERKHWISHTPQHQRSGYHNLVLIPLLIMNIHLFIKKIILKEYKLNIELVELATHLEIKRDNFKDVEKKWPM